MSSIPEKVRIVSDGDPLNTHIYDADTGAEVENAVAVRWDAPSAEEPCVATVKIAPGSEVELLGADVDLTAKAEFVTDWDEMAASLESLANRIRSLIRKGVLP